MADAKYYVADLHEDQAGMRPGLSLPGPSLSGLSLQRAGSEPVTDKDPGPVLLSKLGTHLLASPGNIGDDMNSLSCLRNANSYCAVTY